MATLINTATAMPIPTPITKAEGPYQLQSLDRAVAVLEMLSESEIPLSLAEICQRMHIHKSTAHRSLMVLERGALVERTNENRYRLGLKLYELGTRAVEHTGLRARIHPYFGRLSTQVGETVHLSILQKTSIVYLDKVEPNKSTWMSSKVGTSNPVYCTAMGKAMLAFLPPELAGPIVSRIRFVRYTQKTLCAPEPLLKSLERARRRGYAIDDEEIEAGVRCIGAPIFSADRRPVAAVSISGPASRITAQSVPGIAKQLLDCCREISLALGAHEKRRPHFASSLIQQYGV